MVHDFVEKVDAMRVDIRRFLVSPKRWRSSRVKMPINWGYLKFTDANEALVPEEAGVYAFIVRHENDHFPSHGFIMYIGITGANGNGRTLRNRYHDYLGEKKKNKRPKLHYMLNKYSDDIVFAHAAIPDPKFDLAALELDLNDAIVPPVVVKDFSAEIRQLVKAME
ncbi:MAG: hypothetical protein HS128_06360 [Ideonella sp.]|nr:hypothetical protein [Ideonella sp.]